MKDNRKAEIVNEITALAQRYAGTQQLREHMRGAVLQYLAEQERDTRKECTNSADEWQPIETVPRSGNVLIFVPDNAEGERVISSQFWRIENEHSKSGTPKYVFFAGVDGPDSDIYGATCWMPLPKEPSDNKENA